MCTEQSNLSPIIYALVFTYVQQEFRREILYFLYAKVLKKK